VVKSVLRFTDWQNVIGLPRIGATEKGGGGAHRRLVESSTDDSPPSSVVTKNGVELYLCFEMVWYLIKFRYNFTFMFVQVKPRSVPVRGTLIGKFLQVFLD